MPVLRQLPVGSAAAMLAVVVLAGCSGSGSTGKRAAGSPSAPVAVPPSSSAPATPTPPAPATPTPTHAALVEKPHTAAELRKALLALDDLPPGFQVDTAGGSEPGVAATSSRAACAPLAAILQADQPAGVKAHADAAFSGGQDGPAINETLDSWSSRAQAASFVAGYRKAVLACDQVQLQLPGVGRAVVSVRAVSFGKVGDSLFAARLTAPPGPLAGLEVLQVGAQSGNVVVGMSFMSTDPSDAQSATEDAVKKVQSALNTDSTTS